MRDGNLEEVLRAIRGIIATELAPGDAVTIVVQYVGILRSTKRCAS